MEFKASQTKVFELERSLCIAMKDLRRETETAMSQSVESGKVDRRLMKEELQGEFVSVQKRLRDDVSLQIFDLNRSQQQIEARLQCAASDLCARAAELRQVEQKQAVDLEATGRQLSEIRLRVEGLGEKNREVQELKDLEFKASQTKVFELERSLVIAMKDLRRDTETAMSEFVEVGKVDRRLMKEELQGEFVSVQKRKVDRRLMKEEL